MKRALVTGAVLLLGVGVLAACGASTKAAPGTSVVSVTLTDAGCSVAPSTVPAGPVTFDVRNSGSGAVTEAELLSGPSILAERENVASGFHASFSYQVQPGSYVMNCPGGSTKGTTPFTVTAAKDEASTPASTAVATAALANADTGYVQYVQGQVGLLKSTTLTFDNDVRAGNLAQAEKDYPIARVYYERIEPVAESFGNLDPEIDNRIADAGTLAKLTGFHRIEYAMYVSKSLTGMTPIANGLDADIAQLATLVATLTVQPADLANGATSLLDEVGKTKITGEEERYSNIDLVDFVANVAGSEKAYDLLRPALEVLDPSLVTQIDPRFAALDQKLATYSTGAAPSDYVSYLDVPVTERPVLSQLVDALAAPLSEVGGVVVKA